MEEEEEEQRENNTMSQMSPNVSSLFLHESLDEAMGVWQGMAMDSLKFHLGRPCPTLLCPDGGSPLTQPYVGFRGGLPRGQEACSPLLPLGHRTPYAYDLCLTCFKSRMNKNWL
jgi:hypothetical protein